MNLEKNFLKENILINMSLLKQEQKISKISMKTLIEDIFKSIINQYELNGGVAQLVRAQDS